MVPLLTDRLDGTDELLQVHVGDHERDRRLLRQEQLPVEVLTIILRNFSESRLGSSVTSIITSVGPRRSALVLAVGIRPSRISISSVTGMGRP